MGAAALGLWPPLLQGHRPVITSPRSQPSTTAVLSTSRSTTDTQRASRTGDARRLGVILTERQHYAVDFQKGPLPLLGLTLDAEFTVNDIEAHSPAAYSQIQIGDRLRMVSSAFDGDAASSPWQAARQQDRVRLVFERASIREWEQEVVADAPPAAGARVGSTCLAGASTAHQGTDSCGAGRSLVVSFSAAQQAEGRALEQRKVARPKSNREQAMLLCSLIRQASELPPIPLAIAPQQRWALEFEGQTLKTYRRVSDDRWALAQGAHQLPGASNILPMPPFLQGTPSLPAPAGTPAWASCVLPWLIMASGQLGTRDIETVATTCGLTRLLDLDLDSPRLHAAAAAPPGGRALVGVLAVAGGSLAHADSLALARSAAALQRLVVRRGGVDAELDPVELCCILVHTAQGGAETRLATLLAAWLHWFGRLDLHQAIQEAENAVGAPSEASAIAAASKLLLDGWRERRRAVTLAWPYGGASVEVAGDVLGGWHCRAHLNCTAQGCSVEIRGLEPGSYPYKFIVDGMWVVDMALPAECDAEGNTNNVVHVADDSAEVLSPAQALAHIRLEAARLAMSTKLGIGARRHRGE